MRIRTAALLLTCLTPLWALAERPVLEISNPTFRPLPLAIAAPLGDGTAGGELEETIAFDLLVSGLFDIVPRKGHLADPKEPAELAKIAWSRWSDVGADALVKIETIDGEATLRLFDIATRQLEVEKKGSSKKADLRRLGHAFADALVQHYTREPGAFSTRIAYVRKAKGAKEIWASDYDGRNAAPVTERGGIAMLPSFTPDGGRLAFTYYRRTASYPNGHPELWVADLGGGKLTPLMARGDLNTGASYCRDGSRVAWTMSEEGNTEIWVMNADGSGQKQLTREPGIDASPVFSPDCRRIAFVSDRGGTPQLYLMSADGTGVERLTRLGNYNQTPAWSPRGELIAFTARDERLVFDVFTIDVATREVKRVTQDQGNNEHPSWAPNGRLLIFSSTREGKGGLFVSSPDGDVQRRVSPADGAEYTAPAWGPFPRR